MPKSASGPAIAIHRELLQLLALIVITGVTFFVTRAFAGDVRRMRLNDGDRWFHQGQAQLAAGAVESAAASLRQALARNRSRPDYALALARALVLTRQYEEAGRTLLELRDATPDSPDVNLQLARLAVIRGDVAEAVRYYRAALYAPWPLDRPDDRRAVRFEFIGFLMDHEQAPRALSELLALAADLPDNPDLLVDAGRLFTRAGDLRRALDLFQHALRIAPQHVAALTAASNAAFGLGEYVMARSYLAHVPLDVDAVRPTREIVDLIVSNDPLARGIGTAERRRRLADGLTQATARLGRCAGAAAEPSEADAALMREAQVFADRIRRTRALEQDEVENGVDLVGNIEARVAERCAGLSPIDHAWQLIGNGHGAGSR